MPQKFQAFTQRQHMRSGSFEMYRYRDAYLNEVALHHHDFYEIYLFLQGNVSYTVESRTYHLLPGDLLLINPLELHQPRITPESRPYERLVLWVSAACMAKLSTPRTCLTRCFDATRPEHCNLLRLSGTQRAYMTQLMEQLAACVESDAYGSDLLADACLVQLLVEVNRCAAQPLRFVAPAQVAGGAVAQVLQYINEHYAEDLSLDLLAETFFISKYHLSHEFGRLVGTSVYRYIIQKRLVIAKQMMAGGLAPTQVYSHCGFGDYANFYRAFKAEYQTSPKTFYATVRARAPV